MYIGEKLKQLRRYYGYSQSDLSKRLDVPQTSISNYEQQNEATGMLEYIYKLCTFLKIPVAEFFVDDVKDFGNNLPSYITPADAATLKVLNTAIDIKTRIEIKTAFVHIMKALISRPLSEMIQLPEIQELIDKEEEKLKNEPPSLEFQKFIDEEKRELEAMISKKKEDVKKD
ncbi:MAG: hypothetical protein CVV49_08985 [Spirochaetae bacterium HGW-Spirochaetae-5]|nr:MAG: hypothetical protein CVV49_08985 [Spirochaetae bacterium HGW-Spirochaetae-5]